MRSLWAGQALAHSCRAACRMLGRAPAPRLEKRCSCTLRPGRAMTGSTQAAASGRWASPPSSVALADPYGALPLEGHRLLDQGGDRGSCAPVKPPASTTGTNTSDVSAIAPCTSFLRCPRGRRLIAKVLHEVGHFSSSGDSQAMHRHQRWFWLRGFSGVAMEIAACGAVTVSR